MKCMTSISMFPPLLQGKGGLSLRLRPSAGACPPPCPSSFQVEGPSPPPSPPPPGPAAPTGLGEPGAGLPPSWARLLQVVVYAPAVLCALCLASICTPVTAQPAPSPTPKSHTDPNDLSGAAVAAVQVEVEHLTTQLARLPPPQQHRAPEPAGAPIHRPACLCGRLTGGAGTVTVVPGGDLLNRPVGIY